MNRIREVFNSIPSVIKVLIYTGVSQALGVLLVNLNSGVDIDWRSVVGILIGIVINVLAYLVLAEKGVQG